MPKRARPIHPLGEPLVSSVSRGAELLGLDPARLAEAVERAQLEPWPGRHADGSRVYPWAQLCQLAAALGAKVPATLGHKWRYSEAADRGRTNRYQAKQP